MNNIQKALKLQEIDCAWNGPEPQVSKLSARYLESELTEDGYVRMIRSEDDDGNKVNVSKLKKDFELLTNQNIELKNVAMIKFTAKTRILSKYSEEKQRNMTALALELSMENELTSDETNELAEIKEAWNWIKDVRKTSNAAEINNTPVDEIIWP